jgi:hypothetical protein
MTGAISQIVRYVTPVELWANCPNRDRIVQRRDVVISGPVFEEVAREPLIIFRLSLEC